MEASERMFNISTIHNTIMAKIQFAILNLSDIEERQRERDRGEVH